MATLNELIAQEVNRAFLPHDQHAWLRRDSVGAQPRLQAHIPLGRVRLRANDTDLLLFGAAAARRSLRSPLPWLDEPEELSLYTEASEVELSMTCGVASSPKLNRILRVQPQKLYHESTIDVEGRIRYTQRRINQNAERLGNRIVELGLLRGLVEDSLEPNTWPSFLYKHEICSIKEERLWSNINLTALGGMSVVDIRPAEPPSGPVWEPG